MEATIAYLSNDHQLKLLKIEKALAEIPNMMDRGLATMIAEKKVDLRQKD
jgi:hypothetical protein